MESSVIGGSLDSRAFPEALAYSVCGPSRPVQITTFNRNLFLVCVIGGLLEDYLFPLASLGWFASTVTWIPVCAHFNETLFPEIVDFLGFLLI